METPKKGNGTFTDKNIPEYVWIGLGGLRYYEECEQAIITHFGEKRHKLMAQLLAATSMNNQMKANATQARKALYQLEHGLPFTGYLPIVKTYLELARLGREFPGRKTNNFWKAMYGHDTAVVVDFWMLEAFGYTNRSPTKGQYDLIEAWVQREARKRNVSARGLQAMIWVGVRTKKYGYDETNFSTVFARTSNNLFNVI